MLALLLIQSAPSYTSAPFVSAETLFIHFLCPRGAYRFIFSSLRPLERAPKKSPYPCHARWFGDEWRAVTQGSFQFRKLRRRLPALRSAGDGERSIERLLVRAVGNRGEVGFGEVAPWPGFPTESLAEAEAVLTEAGGCLMKLREKVRAAALPCLGSALSMINEWQAISAHQGSLPCAGLMGEGDGEARAAELASKGYACLKAKVRPGEDRGRFRAILAATPAELTLRLDANGRLDLTEALELLDWVRGEPRVEFVEQPLAPGNPGYAVLGSAKVALDESFPCRSRRAPEAMGWEGFVVVKPAMAGDWDEARALLRERAPDRLVISSAFETAVGFQSGLAFAAALGARRAIGFGTLGADTAWERHAPGAMLAGNPDIDWEALWARAR